MCRRKTGGTEKGTMDMPTKWWLSIYLRFAGLRLKIAAGCSAR